MVFVNCRPTKPRIELMKEACIGRRYFSQLASIRPKEVFSCLVTVRYIHKISINCVCSGCGNAITRGTCTYVGCHWNQPSCKVDLKAWYVPDPVTILIVLANVCLCVCVARPPPFFFFRRVCVCRPSSCTLALYLSLQRGAIDFRLRHTHTHTQSRILPLQSHSLQRLTHSMLFSPYVVLSFLAFFFSYAIGVNVSRRVFISWPSVIKSSRMDYMTGGVWLLLLLLH